ncbi:Tetratricopeptide repeat-domain-containing protein [Jimgerdemannia flammicorona]|uniref:Tetratricopeptide repeat-domain-containing protein n=1 Tax=Jimgerdemannia flammicorona TaxID=994334 RepID=A0A433QPJ6_9FUNG|nr:Tetratricopeptide repeat-domain-containing protein [Jimgerdemannia flammicorona]
MAISISEVKLGMNNTTTAISLRTLALLYFRQGKYDKAEILYKWVLVICEKEMGSEHLNAANTLNSLAVLYKNWGKFDKAEPLYE